MSCSTSGVRDGAIVTFSVYPDGANPETDPPLMDIRGTNKGSSSSVKWMARDIRQDGSRNPMRYFFTAWTMYCPKEQSEVVEVVQKLDGTVLDSLGSPAADVSYTLTMLDGSEKTGKTDQEGKILEEELIPGEYTIKFDFNNQ